jgi:acetolactate synthase small subunit
MRVSDDPAGCGPQGDEAAMKQTISVFLHDRFNDAERIIGMFSGTGYKIEKMLLTKNGKQTDSRLVIVTDATGKNIDNLVTRLRQQIRVSLVECTEGDNLPDDDKVYSLKSKKGDRNDT